MWTIAHRLTVPLLIAVGVSVMPIPEPGVWLKPALIIYCCALALRWLAHDPRFAGGRQIVGLSTPRLYRVSWAANLAAG